MFNNVKTLLEIAIATVLTLACVQMAFVITDGLAASGNTIIERNDFIQNNLLLWQLGWLNWMLGALVFGFGQPWLQWKLMIILAIIIPLEIADIWYGNVKLPQIFSQLNMQGYDKLSAKRLHIYHAYVTRTAIAVIPTSVLTIMWLVIAKPNIISPWQ